MRNGSATDIRRAAMDLLARREHSRRELQQKLMQRFPDNPLVECEIERLCDEHLQSDERFTEVYLHSRARRLYGPQRIKAELRERGIADTVIVKVFKQTAIDWYANRQTLELNKFGHKPPSDLKEKAKRMRFLQYRGFGATASESVES